MQTRRGSTRPTRPEGAGVLSGPANHALAIRLVYQAAGSVRIPVIGIGGIICGADAAEFLRAGAVAVQIGTANFYDPLATVRIVRELKEYCRRSGIRHVGQIRETQKETATETLPHKAVPAAQEPT